MPKLPALTPQQVITIIERHGFILDHSSRSHCLSKRQKKIRVSAVTMRPHSLTASAA
jgi:predicted RNA binding protein YcfA (HicA-like mRNA interferase family)